MEELIDKVAFLLMPNNFAKILPYCFWYWIMFTLIVYWIVKKK
jgi:hypothetical protein